jgi:hypothetical protein
LDGLLERDGVEIEVLAGCHRVIVTHKGS